jgi:uncharacterized protein YqeY
MLMKQIEEDLKAALKSKNSTKLETLRMLKAAVNNFLIEKKKDKIDDAEIIPIIQKQVKQRLDSIEGFTRGGRTDLVTREADEKAILEAYLPKPLSDEELKSLVQKAIQSTGAKGKNDLGKVMKEVMGQSQGRAEGRRINQFALEILGAGS